MNRPPGHAAAHLDADGTSPTTGGQWDSAMGGRLVVDNYAGALLLFDTDLRYRLVGGTNFEMVGWSPEQLLGRTIWEAFPADTAASLEPSYRAALGGDTVSFDIPFEGRIYEVEIVPVRVGDPSSIIAGLSSTRDVTVEREIARALGEAQETFRMAFANAPIGMVIIELDGRLRSVNQALCDITGYSQIELRTRTIADLVDGEDVLVTRAQLRRLIDDEAGANEIEVEIRHARGHLVWVALSACMVRDSAGSPSFFIGQLQDITVRKRQEQALRYQAERDNLTGLWNRGRFDQELASSRSIAELGGESGSVILLDLDRLKTINDTYGHRVGDDALRRIGEVLGAGVRGRDMAFRYGGDEFAVILPHTTGDTATRLKDRLLGDIARQRLVVGDHIVAISASAGVAEITKGIDPIATADGALYEAKRARVAP